MYVWRTAASRPTHACLMLLHSQSQSQCDRVGTRHRARERGREDAFFLSCAHLSSGTPDPTQHGVERARRQEGRELRPTGGRAPPPAPSIALAVPSFFLSFLLSSSSGRSADDRGSAQRGELPSFRPSARPCSSAVRPSVDPTVSRSVDPFPPSTVFRNSSSGTRRRHLRARSQARDLPRRNPSWRPPTRASSA